MVQRGLPVRPLAGPAGLGPQQLIARGWIAVALLGLLAVVYVLALDTSSGLTFDAQAARDPVTGQLRTGSPELLMVPVTWVGAAASVALLGLALLAQALNRGGPVAALMAAAPVVGCFVSAELLKWGLGEVALLSAETDHGSSASFPSVHAAVAMALVLGLASAAPAPWRRVAVGLAVAYPTAIGAVALLEGWHYPSDIAAGHLLGAAWALTVTAAGQRLGAAWALTVTAAGPRGTPFRDRRLDAAATACAGLALVLLVAMLVDSLMRYVPDRILGGPFLGGAAAIAVSAGCAAVAVFGLAPAGAATTAR